MAVSARINLLDFVRFFSEGTVVVLATSLCCKSKDRKIRVIAPSNIMKNLFKSSFGRFLQAVLLIIGVTVIVLATVRLIEKLGMHIHKYLNGGRS